MNEISEIKMCLEQRCKDDDNWNLTWLECWFYAIKTAICALFDLGAMPRNFYDYVIVATYGYGEPAHYEYGGVYWTSIIVGHGVSKNWFYTHMDDSSV